MMNSPDAAGPWCFYNDNAGEATAVPTTGESGSLFADMVADYSTDDLFELVWEQEGKTSSGASGPAVSCLWSPKFSKPPDVRFDFDPSSEDEIAAWFDAIVKGGTFASCADDDGTRQPMADDGRRDVVPPTMGTMSTVTEKKEKVSTTTTEGMMMGNNKEMRKAPTGVSSRRSHHGEAHNLTEKRRRHKINERLKTLRQLVPGCSKSNQASTLDQTIQYMKSLQHQLQAMSVGSLAAPAGYPVVQPPQCVPPGTPFAMPFPAAPMVPLRTTILQLPHYPAAAAVMMPLYPAAAPRSTAVAPGPAAGDAMSANHRHIWL